MKCTLEHFDTSDDPADSKYGLPQFSEKVLGKMKDEVAGAIMEEFVGLRAKIYAFRVGRKDKKKAKVIKNVWWTGNLLLLITKNACSVNKSCTRE
jgi:hypothetical protein